MVRVAVFVDAGYLFAQGSKELPGGWIGGSACCWGIGLFAAGFR